MIAIRPYSRKNALAKLDGRRREARLMRDITAALTAHVGGSPSATQIALIERVARLTLHVSLLDAKAQDGVLTEHDSRTYLAWSNTLTRTLRALGMDGAAPALPDLKTYIATRPASRGAASA